MTVVLENVTKVYNPGQPNEVWAVKGISLRINKNEAVVLKGPSGSGKTSLLSLIGCMSRPTSGRILISGRDVAKLPERSLTEIRRRTFGFVFQQFNLLKGITVRENIMLPLYPTGLSLTEIKARAEKVMESMRLSKRADFNVEHLSGGEQQRVAIARALINDPEIILADEPTAHLDTKLSEEFLRIIEEIKRSGKTVIIATHDPLVYDSSVVDRVIELRDGMIKETQ
jgi:putative ABC transport system ATP-binding protein